MSAGNLQRVRERQTKAGGEETRSKAWLKTEEKKRRRKTDLCWTARKQKSVRGKNTGGEESKLKTTLQPFIWNKSCVEER